MLQSSTLSSPNDAKDAAWKVAVPRMAVHASATSAVYEILRHSLPTHTLLPVSPLVRPGNDKVQKHHIQSQVIAPAADVVEDEAEFETTSWTDWSGEDEFMAQVLDQEDVMGPALAIAFPVDAM